MSFELVVVGASLGGLHAVSELLRRLPADFSLPIAVAQHRHKESDATLRVVLQQASRLPVCEVEDKQIIRPGLVCLAPANYHLLVEHGTYALSTDELVMLARPSIDVLFESAADVYGSAVIGVILTGASTDGAQGLAAIKAAGGLTVVQEPATAECDVMPRAAIETGTVEHVLPVPAIAALLTSLGTVVPKVGQ